VKKIPPILLVIVSLLQAFAVGAETAMKVSITTPPNGTTAADPRIRVEGYAQAVRDHAPQQYDVMFIIDTSGSTGAPSGTYVKGKGGSILVAEVEAAERLLDRLDPRTTRVGVVTFSGAYNRFTGLAVPGASGAFLQQPLTSNFALVRAALSKILQDGPDGGTDMAAGVRLAVRELVGLQGHVSVSRQGSKPVALLLTDGFPTLPFGRVNSMDPEDVEIAISAAKVAEAAGIVIHTFAIGPEALSAPIACTEIARVTKGTFTPLQDPGQVIDVLPKTSIADLDLVSVFNATTGELAKDLVVNPDGRFSALVSLVKGANRITVEALATDGARGSDSVLVHYAADGSLHLDLVKEGDKQLELKLEELQLKLEKLKDRTKEMELDVRKAEEERQKQLQLELKKAEEERLKKLELQISVEKPGEEKK